MSSTVQMETVEYFKDARGLVLEPLLTEQIAAQQNLHVVLTEPGAVRGNHLHPKGTEICTIIGPALVRFRENGKLWDVEIPAAEARRFVIPPGVSHAMYNPGPGIMLIAAGNSLPLDRERPDLVRDVLIDPKEFGR